MRKKIGQILLEAGYVTEAQISEALSIQSTTKTPRIGKILVNLGYVTKDQVADALARKLNVPLTNCESAEIENELKLLVPKDLAVRQMIFPLERKGDTLVLAMVDPLDYRTMDDITFRTKLRVAPVLAHERSILRAIEKNYQEEVSVFDAFTGDVTLDREFQFMEDSRKDEDSSHANIEELYTQSQAPTVIKLVATIMTEAVKARASDIHLEPQKKFINVRFRVDGDLRTIFRYKRNIHDSVVSRIKIISNLDITNRRLPQGGSTRVCFRGNEIDLRISTLPAICGEKVVVRILDQSIGLIPLGELGIPEPILESIIDIFKSPQGMFIVTGPTGSGKTTTLYACINQLRSEAKNVLTIEDPVEYKLDGITQVQVDESIGRTFAAVLRTLLRQDPDVIKVGEVRDLETADIAIKAALTGHLVLTTLHTNSTVASITRLVDIGIPPYLLSSAISGILAQRLVRKICYNCKAESDIPDYLLRLIEGYDLPKVTKSHYGKGCQKCFNTGFSGRIAVYEFLPVSRKLRGLIARNATEEELLQQARQEGVTLLFEDAWNKVRAGLTTVEEVLGKVPVDYLLMS